VQGEDVDRWLRLSAVAARIGRSRETARQLVVGGSIKGVRHSPRGAWQVRESECDRYVADLESGTLTAEPASVPAAA